MLKEQAAQMLKQKEIHLDNQRLGSEMVNTLNLRFTNAISVMRRSIQVSLRRSTSNIDLTATTSMRHICLLGKVAFVVYTMNLRTTSSGFKKRKQRGSKQMHVALSPPQIEE